MIEKVGEIIHLNTSITSTCFLGEVTLLTLSYLCEADTNLLVLDLGMQKINRASILLSIPLLVSY